MKPRALKQRCVHGHPIDGVQRMGTRTRRYCRTCNTRNVTRWAERHPELRGRRSRAYYLRMRGRLDAVLRTCLRCGLGFHHRYLGETQRWLCRGCAPQITSWRRVERFLLQAETILERAAVVEACSAP